MQLQNISPPERSSISRCLWNPMIIIAVPYHGHPRNINLVIEFVKMLEKQSFVLDVQINNAQTTLISWPANELPSSQGLFWSIIITPPKALPEDPVQLLNDPGWDIEATQKVYWQRGQDRGEELQTRALIQHRRACS